MIENISGATLITGRADIARTSVLALRSALALEVAGIQVTRGASASAIAKRRFGLPKGWSKASCLGWLSAFIDVQVLPKMNSDIPTIFPHVGEPKEGLDG